MICLNSNRVGRLNVFQRVMLQWSELSPYNAAHTYRLAGRLDLPALEEAVRETFALNGIGIAEIDPDGVWYCHQRDDAPTIELVDGEGPAEDRLIDHVARGINRPFGRPLCRPFRISAVDGGPRSHYVTLIYDHWAADSVGARLIMRHVLGRYLKLAIPENSDPLDLYPGTYGEVFGNRLRGARLAMPVLRSLGGWLKNRTARQTAYASTSQMSVGYALYRVRRETLQAVRQFARRNGASVNDVFLAALGRATGPFLPRRSAKGGTRDMNLGTIVDTRADASEDLSQSLGTFLGYYVVRMADDRTVPLADLVRMVAATTGAIKQRRGYLDSAVNLGVSSAIWSRLQPRNRPHFGRRVLPLTAGVTNIYLRDPWITRQGAGRILDFHRAASTGPSLPLVISPTTLNDQMNIGVSYRETGFSRRRIDDILAAFIGQLESLAGRSETPMLAADATSSPVGGWSLPTPLSCLQAIS